MPNFKKRFFISKDVLSTIALRVPDPKDKWDKEWEVTMRDCSRQIHWLFTSNRSGLAKAKRVAAFFDYLVESMEKHMEKK